MRPILARRLVPAAGLVVALAAARSAAAQAQATVANPHVELRGRACTACHTTQNWRDVVFDHGKTGTPLRGQHASAPCTGCHNLRDFRTAARECRTCHQDPHRGDAGLRCEQCHDEASWQQVSARDAHARTRLPELGVHASLRCVDCHRQAAFQQFSGAVTPCVACHQATYAATTSPAHASMGFSAQCESCHQFTTWNFALYAQHDAIFGIYTGAHAGAWRNCASCHTSGTDYSVFSCTVCHAQTRTDAEHASLGSAYSYQSSACLMCHPTGARGSFAQHDALFPIFSGAHQGTWTSCAACHPAGGSSTSFTCMSAGCHAQAATDPIHGGITGYAYVAAQCLSCHPTGGPASFTQHDALFPIYSGSHKGVWTACTACHPTAGSPNLFTCMSSGCHAQAATDPIHTGVSGYSYAGPQCLSCHPTGQPASFTQHDALYFPIYSGSHAGTWSACTACHPTAGSPTVFTCMSSGCHAQAATDPLHTGITGYSYAAAQCLSCHPTGLPASFTQHDALYFPIYSGSHAGTWSACTSCHPTAGSPNVYTCMSAGCHPQASTDPIHTGITGYSYTASQCLSCHPTGLQASFTQHDALYFPIYSGNHAGVWATCTACHPTAGSPTVFTCMSSGCHPQASTDSQHQGRTGYSYTAAACYSCHPRGSSG
ncbi:MAG TPA: hypothetical protein VEH83_09045 [Gemmatimonadales bacterium]|nr:hypothetical protein [Gemmatimonadales bacterium]